MNISLVKVNYLSSSTKKLNISITSVLKLKFIEKVILNFIISKYTYSVILIKLLIELFIRAILENIEAITRA